MRLVSHLPFSVPRFVDDLHRTQAFSVVTVKVCVLSFLQ